MNIELLKQVRDAIVDEANAFDMGQWGVGLSKSGRWWFATYNSDDAMWATAAANACGTAACLAGWTVRLGRPQKKRVERGTGSRHNPGTYAGRILGIEPGAWGQPKDLGAHALVALVDAPTELGAADVIFEGWPEQRGMQWRFFKEKPADYVPGNRFPLKEAS